MVQLVCMLRKASCAVKKEVAFERARLKKCVQSVFLSNFLWFLKTDWLHCRVFVCCLLHWSEYLNLIHFFLRVWLLPYKFCCAVFFFLQLEYKVRKKSGCISFVLCILFLFYTVPCDHLVVSTSWRNLKSRCLGITDTAPAEKSRVFEREENNF